MTRYKEGKYLGPLDGVPFAVKDEYEVDGYLTCLGSRNDRRPRRHTPGRPIDFMKKAGCTVHAACRLPGH